MFIDNSFFVKENSYLLFEKINSKGKLKAVFSQPYLRFEKVEFSYKNCIATKALELSCEKKFNL